MSNSTLGWVELGFWQSRPRNLRTHIITWDKSQTGLFFLLVMPETETRLSYYSDNWNPLSDIRLIQNSIQNTKSISERIRSWTIMQDQD